jgi:crotonobetaine/carnitine-CoA ligase
MLMQEILELARQRGDRPFLHFGDRTWSYAQYAGMCEASAAAWVKAGIRPGDRAALLLPNSPQYLAALHGIALVGGVSVPMNTGYRPQEARYVLENSSSTMILTNQDLTASTIAPVRSELAGVREVLLVDRPEDGFDGTGAVPAPGPSTWPQLNDQDLAAVLYTSGTSGSPKGALAPQCQAAVNGRGLGQAIDLHEHDVHFSIFPLFHINAQTIVSAALLVGAEVVLGTRFSVTEFWPTVHRHGVTHVSYLGSVIPLLDKRRDPLEADNSLRVMWGAGTPAETQARLEQRWGVRFVEVYGMTEIGIVLANSVNGPRRAGSCGTPVGEHRITIIDDKNAEVPAGVIGELVVDHRPGMFRGYLGDQAATDAAVRDGLVHTGDAARRDDDGFFYFVDRYKDIIRRSGENISSADVERAVLEHPQVLDAAAIPAPDELRNEEVRIVIVLKEATGGGIAPEELLRWCRERLAPYKVPRFIEFADDLPRTPTGKIRKQYLRGQFRARRYFDADGSVWCEAASATLPAATPARAGRSASAPA